MGQALEVCMMSPDSLPSPPSKPFPKTLHRLLYAVFTQLLLLAPLPAQQPKVDLTAFSLEDLANIKVTSVSRKEQKLFEAASAIFVITSDDIRRSGMSNLAEILRMAPGLDIAQIDANKWSTTARGFGERYPDKMLVLLDGRTLYSPLTSGVTWDVQETLLEDIERIEIIRGPGATLWGSNAVNGVINIITKNAADTRGFLGGATLADQDRSSGTVRYGGHIAPAGYARGWAQYFDRDGSRQSTGPNAPDGWHDLRAGFRADWDLFSQSNLTLVGDLYRGRSGTTIPGIISLWPPLTGTFVDKAISTGGDLNARWTRKSHNLDSMIRAYIDIAHRNEYTVLDVNRSTFDLEVVERYHAHPRHDVVFGGDFRANADRTVGSINMSFDPARRSTQLYGIFGQDEISLIPDQLRLTLGTKLEHNYYSGYALQPNGRIIFIPNDRSAIWAAISRASESASRTDADVRTNADPYIDANGVLTISSSFGTPHVPPENVAAYELGGRLQANRAVAFDLATFYNHYSNRHTDEPGPAFYEDTPAPRHLVLPTYVHSNISGETHGLEFVVRTQPTPRWALSGSYSLFEIHLRQSAASLDFETATESAGDTPRHKFQLHSAWTLPHQIEIDSSLYFVGSLPVPQIAKYARVDMRVGWHPVAAFEISAGGKNIFQAEHFEFPSGELVQSEPIARSAYLKATWRF